MEVREAIERRRAIRSLAPVEITEELLRTLARAAQLAPSCFNNQPARFVFVFEAKILKEMHTALSAGNEWARAASLIIAVFSRPQDDCIMKDRQYHQFDCGLAVAFLILQATELGLIAHPIAGFSPKKTREILGIPEDFQVITLIIVGRQAEVISPVLSEKQLEWEKTRPTRLPLEKIVHFNRFRS